MVSLYHCNTSETVQKLFLFVFQKIIFSSSIYIELKTHKNLFSKNSLQRQSSTLSKKKNNLSLKCDVFNMINQSHSKTNHTTALFFFTIIFFICGFSASF